MKVVYLQCYYITGAQLIKQYTNARVLHVLYNQHRMNRNIKYTLQILLTHDPKLRTLGMDNI